MDSSKHYFTVALCSQLTVLTTVGVKFTHKFGSSRTVPQNLESGKREYPAMLGYIVLRFRL